MTSNQITKIRKNAFEIRSIADNNEPKQTKGEPEACFPRMRRLADEILALLPCSTCNGTKIGRIDNGRGGTKFIAPCPDCQPEPRETCPHGMIRGEPCRKCSELYEKTLGPKPDCKKYCVCCEEITEENAHLHRNPERENGIYERSFAWA